MVHVLELGNELVKCAGGFWQDAEASWDHTGKVPGF